MNRPKKTSKPSWGNFSKGFYVPESYSFGRGSLEILAEANGWDLKTLTEIIPRLKCVSGSVVLVTDDSE